MGGREGLLKRWLYDDFGCFLGKEKKYYY